MGNKLFVRNLPWRVREDDLRRWLEERGIACEKVEVVLEKGTERSRGFGFLHFATDSAAAEAVEELDGVEIDGRPIHVEEASSRGGSSGGRRGGSGRLGNRNDEDDWA
jgi:RNA recognition motif-containing protein